MFFVPIVLLNLFFVYIRTCVILADTCVVVNGFRIKLSYMQLLLTQCYYVTFFFEARSQNCEKRLLSVCPSVRPSVLPLEWNNSAPTGWIFREI